jgi:hypothetical protein
VANSDADAPRRWLDEITRNAEDSEVLENLLGIAL